jgi:hypothetical protein
LVPQAALLLVPSTQVVPLKHLPTLQIQVPRKQTLPLVVQSVQLAPHWVSVVRQELPLMHPPQVTQVPF